MFYALPCLYAVKMRRNARRDHARNWNALHYARVMCEHVSREAPKVQHDWQWIRSYL
jgi:hypothetical protein